MSYQHLPFHQYFIDNSEDCHNTGKARRNVQYRAVSYQCDSLIEKWLGLNHEVNYEIFYETDRNVIQINFQKTNDRMDWFANIAEFSDRYYDSFPYMGKKLQLRVHHGWGEMYRTIKTEIRESWKALHDAHPDAETEIIGWSLGSGQAMLCAQDLNFNFGLKAHLFTFGSVRPFRATPFNRGLMERYLNSLCKECWNFAHVNDVVTYMPPFRGFSMLNRITLGEEKRTLRKLLNPYLYHLMYDEEKLY